MDDQRDYAEEAAIQRDMEREGAEELAAEREEQRLLDAIQKTIAARRARGDSSAGILRQVESLLAGVEVFLEVRGTEDGTGEPKPAHVEGHTHVRGDAAWATQPSGEQRVAVADAAQ